MTFEQGEDDCRPKYFLAHQSKSTPIITFIEYFRVFPNNFASKRTAGALWETDATKIFLFAKRFTTSAFSIFPTWWLNMNSLAGIINLPTWNQNSPKLKALLFRIKQEVPVFMHTPSKRCNSWTSHSELILSCQEWWRFWHPNVELLMSALDVPHVFLLGRSIDYFWGVRTSIEPGLRQDFHKPATVVPAWLEQTDMGFPLSPAKREWDTFSCCPFGEAWSTSLNFCSGQQTQPLAQIGQHPKLGNWKKEIQFFP